MCSVARIAVIDDHALFRAGVRQAVDAAVGLEIVAEGSNAMDALEIAQSSEHDMMLMDINMPGGGINAARSIAVAHPEAKMVFLTNSESAANVAEVMQLGARGYIVKGIGGRELIEILRLVHSGESYVSPNLGAQVLRDLYRDRTMTQFRELRC
jgi:two-component system, NarL family, nitrate/nitrite response regulator NarL